MSLNKIKDIIDDIRLGKMVVLMDDEDRENEGDLILAASHVRAEDINFMAKEARGLICLPMTEERCRQLKLPLMVDKNQSSHGTNFTLSIEASKGVETGISARDRAITIQAAVAANAKPEDIVYPGHVFPLKCEPGGVLRRAGHTEAAVDLARLAGLEPAAVIVEIMNEDGTMARRPNLEKFARKHHLKIGTIADLIHYRMLNEKSVQRIDHGPLHTSAGDFEAIVYNDIVDQSQHLALVKGDLSKEESPFVRVQEVDVWRDVVNVKRNNPLSWSARNSMHQIEKEGAGVVLFLGYMPKESDLFDQFSAVSQASTSKVSTEKEAPKVEIKMIGTGSQILKDLGVTKMKLMSSPMKFNALSGFDLEIVEYISAPF